MDDKICKNCIHYQMCVDTFRKGKQDGEYLLVEEDAYFANADGCDFYADKRIYCKVKHGKWIEHEDDWCGVFYTCSVCKCDWTTIDGTPQENNMNFCPECGARMDKKE